jgi:hypothetical protein
MQRQPCRGVDQRCCVNSVKRYIARIGVFNCSFRDDAHGLFTLQKFNRFFENASFELHRIKMECSHRYIGVYIDNREMFEPRYTKSKEHEEAQFALDGWRTPFKTTKTTKFFTIDFTYDLNSVKTEYLRRHENEIVPPAKSILYYIFDRTVLNLEYHEIAYKHHISIILPWFDRRDRMIFENYLIIFHSFTPDFLSEFHSRLPLLFLFIHLYL